MSEKSTVVSEIVPQRPLVNLSVIIPTESFSLSENVSSPPPSSFEKTNNTKKRKREGEPEPCSSGLVHDVLSTDVKSSLRRMNAILYVSSKKQSEGGLTSISTFVDYPKQFNQKLGVQWIDIPPHVDILFTKKITKNCWRVEPDLSKESMDERYQETNDYEIAIIHEKFRGDIKAPYFLNTELINAQNAKKEMDGFIQDEYAFYHINGPLVYSSDWKTLFSMNDEELDFFQSIVHYVLYYFEDLHGKENYRELLENQEE